MKSRAAICYGPGVPLEVDEIDLDDPKPDDVVVRMTAVGVCGTDLHQIKGEWQRPTPMVLGHEGSGVIERVGSHVDPARVGERVVLAWSASCGSCRDCARGRPAACVVLHRAIAAGTLIDGTTGLSLRGQRVYRGTATGALGERVVVKDRLALPVGDDVPLDQAALLGCAALTGVGAVLFVARPPRGAVIVVLGVGGVGQFCVQAARLSAARLVICADLLASRRSRALELGATHSVDPSELADVLAETAPEGADFAFDVVGTSESTALALQSTRSGGTTVIVGLPPAGARLDLDFAEFNRREKWLTGTMYGSQDPAVALPILLDLVRSGQLDLASMLGPTYPLDLVNDAISASLAGSAGRVLVAP
jgi:S-(hydroxymethyl)glutathione dehydrogenase / alcohol dehydrogenase